MNELPFPSVEINTPFGKLKLIVCNEDAVTTAPNQVISIGGVEHTLFYCGWNHPPDFYEEKGFYCCGAALQPVKGKTTMTKKASAAFYKWYASMPKVLNEKVTLEIRKEAQMVWHINEAQMRVQKIHKHMQDAAIYAKQAGMVMPKQWADIKTIFELLAMGDE